MTLGNDTNRAALAADETAPSEAPAPESTPKLRELPVGDRYWRLFAQCLIGDQPHVADFSRSLLGEADGAVENAIGYVGTPLGVLPKLLMNNLVWVVPMATEERSVIASAAKGATMCAATGGVFVDAATRPRVYAQIFYGSPATPQRLQWRLMNLTAEIEAFANANGGQMTARGGAPMTVTSIDLLGALGDDQDVVLLLEFDTRDAMGANVVTGMAEKIAAFLHQRHSLPLHTAAICSNYRSGWHVVARAVWPTPDTVRMQKTLLTARWASRDPHRLPTHIKGIMNGVDAVAKATGQDDRAMAACAYTLQTDDGLRNHLSSFRERTLCDGTPAIAGELELWIPCGTKGGATGLPFFRECLGILRNPDARTLASIMAATGLVQNFAALWSLAGEGIPAAHERLKK